MFAMYRRIFESLIRRFFSARASFVFKKKVYAHGMFTVVNPSNVTIGSDCSINAGVFISDFPRVVIGDRVTLSARVMLSQQCPSLKGEVVRKSPVITSIGDDAWIGAGAIIFPGVQIGARAVVGAGSVVVNDIPADGVAIGNPAETIKKRGGLGYPVVTVDAV